MLLFVLSGDDDDAATIRPIYNREDVAQNGEYYITEWGNCAARLVSSGELLKIYKQSGSIFSCTQLSILSNFYGGKVSLFTFISLTLEYLLGIWKILSRLEYK